MIQSIVSLILHIAALSIIYVLYKDLLKESWRDYRKKIWLKVIASIVGVLVMYLILFSIRQLMPPITSTGEEFNSDGMVPSIMIFLYSFIPIFIPFLEEIIFRHVLFYKFKGNKFLLILFFFVSAFLFGAAHMNNFDGNLLLTLPYMVVGTFLSLVYLFANNIWYAIGIHFLFNFTNSFLAMIFYFIV